MQNAGNGVVVGWRCAVCSTSLDIAAVHPFRCPRSTETDRRHVLHPVATSDESDRLDDANPFVADGPRLAWWAFARANGMSERACVELTSEISDGFAVTPFSASAALSAELGGDIWIKDETANVGGSHKGRHLVTILLHLRAAEELGLAPYGSNRPPLAIASCGNAAIAAATLAQRSEWPLQVFVPEWASADVRGHLARLGADVTTCPRRNDGGPGDPSLLRFREAVSAGAIPFTAQGPENALCLDGGRTIGWELAAAPSPPERVLVQVGGGAFAACAGWGLGSGIRLDAVQTAGCAPLARAWARAGGIPTDELGRQWSELMTPWVDPHSAADGILDDETYDWLGVVDVMRRSGGRPLVVTEDDVRRAHDMATAAGNTASATGSAGLAGLLADPPRAGERTAVIFSGVAR